MSERDGTYDVVATGVWCPPEVVLIRATGLVVVVDDDATPVGVVTIERLQAAAARGERDLRSLGLTGVPAESGGTYDTHRYRFGNLVVDEELGRLTVWPHRAVDTRPDLPGGAGSGVRSRRSDDSRLHGGPLPTLLVVSCEPYRHANEVVVYRPGTECSTPEPEPHPLVLER